MVRLVLICGGWIVDRERLPFVYFGAVLGQ